MREAIVDIASRSILMHLSLYNAPTPFWVAIAAVFHLFPFRTEQLSPLAPMVLQCNAGE